MPEIILIETTKTKRGNVAILLRPAITRPVGRYIVTCYLYDDTPGHLEWYCGEYFDDLAEAVQRYHEIIHDNESE